ncbi:MAG: N-acetylmuramoyl-L-alanine amidase, partial [Herbinix sp.]|nr:N-acetylmuramoyl-L-alanine amidase [Herbinix sp.]
NPMTLSAAPVYVTNYETKTSYVMVPGSITASCLGYDYKWNSSTKTSVITTQKNTSTGGDNSGEDPELGDSGDIIETGTTLNQWTALTSQYGESSTVHEIAAATTSYNGTITSVSRDYSNTKKNSETFMIAANTTFNKLTSNSSGNIITIQADNMSCIDQTNQTYGYSSNLINKISTYNNAVTLSSSIELEVLQENYQYDIALSADKQILYVTVYYNTLTSAIIGTNSKCDYLNLSGISPLDATITEAAGLIYIDFPYTINSLGDLNTEVKGSNYIKQIFSINMQDKTQIVLSMNEGYQYYYQENGNQFTIIFQSKDSTNQSDPQEIIDKSKYEIVIPKPSAITSAMISDEDFYYNNYFVINLQGDYKDYFNNQPISNNSSTAYKISVSLNSSGNTVIKIATSKLQGYEIASDNENIYVNIGNPRDIYKNIVVLDPGHGGAATGALKNGKQEKNINFKILYTIGKKYFNQDTAKLKVYYTRTSDVDLSLKERAAFANKVGADLFVSLHMNSAENAPSAKGTEVFYSHNNNVANSAGLTSSTLASYLVKNLYPALGTNNRGVKEDIFTVIDKNTVPAVLIELGFLSNTSDYSVITNEEKQAVAAETIYKTLLQVFEKYPTGR